MPDASRQAEQERGQQQWHALDVQEVCQRLGVDQDGLAEAEANNRLISFGPNILPQHPPPTWFNIFLRQLRSPIIYILGVAAAVSVIIGHFSDAGFIGFVVAVNASVGGYQEYRAERSALALQQLLRTLASVVRDGEVREITADHVVPGDVVWLEPGNRVPADIRLTGSYGFEIDESLLTGESLAVEKSHERTCTGRTPVGDQCNMAFAGTVVARGRGKGVVVATGVSTQIGQLALEVLQAPSGKPPLLVRLDSFTKSVGFAVLLAAFVIGTLGVLLQEYSVLDMFMFAVALAVSAIPEGLPIAITVALAVAAARMAKRGVIVRRLGAVEGLGSCTLIASDKTGTLTCNELTVNEIRLADGRRIVVTGEGFTPTGRAIEGGRGIGRGEIELLDSLTLASVLCNEADLHQRDGNWSWRGDPTDVALLSMAHKMGWVRETTLDSHPQFSKIPFEPEFRYAATFHLVEGQPRVFVKGAPERVLKMCALEQDELDAAHAEAESLAGAGHRVLAFATGKAGKLKGGQVPKEPKDMQFLGFVGMRDPLRPGVREAIGQCHQAGIGVCMITGDHPVTALAIARDLGFAQTPGQVLTGDSLAEMDEAEFKAQVASTRVFARVAPGQKLDIVRAAQKAGLFVAVTGDGANDAPALRAANIGVAMGKSGTDVARESCDMVISDDNFGTIVAGVEEGRVAYDNIRKVVYLLVSTGAAEVILVMLAVATGTPLPLLPVQLLWLNLVTNGIQDIAIGLEPAEKGILQRKPRSPRERIFNRLMIENCAFAAIVMGITGFLVFQWMLNAGWSEGSARNGLLLLMVLFENVHIGACRSETQSALTISPFRSPLLLGGAISVFLLHVLMMNIPLGHALLQTEPVSLTTWVVLGAVAVAFFGTVEFHKWTWRYRMGV